MRMIALLCVCLVTQAYGQISPDEAYARLRDRQKAHAQTQPTTKPNGLPAHGTIIFVLDARGRMLGTFAEVRSQVAVAISELNPGQRFNIICFPGAGFTAFAKQPALATEKQKRSAADFLDPKVTPHGDGEPFGAIKDAMRQRPDVVWVVSCDLGVNLSKIQAEIPPNWKGKLNTAIFESGSNSDIGARHEMWTLADWNHGVCIDRRGAVVEEPTLSSDSSGEAPADESPSIFSGK